ncbi:MULTISPECIES: hypothetical protein [unclassified Mesorhizobium]|uniref:hypothetical protein n=1 Tax=unclassified Mesorhizobium TaxID=325217 RepID=UPI001126C6B4|nr:MULTISPECIES: hypothetical protein [unclassified Mesorhizobium]MCA0027336.1 hypothetical protein [Mesorhizobium sp. B263B1A]TPJ98611.1 hypothetical protein FJ489_06700 [Mesorhizobium sp. B2-5-12]TPK28773.1 hypothetical protein FJ562_00090 [Mesorhizobium sp. B2-5-6]
MARLPNPLRGEAPLRIGTVDVVIGIEFDRLAAYSGVTFIDEMSAALQSLVSFSPRHAKAALDCFVIDGDAADAKASLTAADAQAWRKAFTAAIAAHLAKAGERGKEQTPGNG